MYTHLWFTFTPKAFQSAGASGDVGSSSGSKGVKSGMADSAEDNRPSKEALAAQRAKVLMLMAYPSVYAMVS